jgi:large subunit ribosomal protein L1
MTIKNSYKNKHSNRYQNLKSYIKNSTYSIIDGINLLKKFGTTKFIETVETHISLNIDPKYGHQQIRSNVVLPYYNSNINRKIAVLSLQDSKSKFLNAGATLVGYEDLLSDISHNIISFDILLTTPDMMPQLAKLGNILGPKGLMPSAKSGTVTNNIEETILEYKKGKIEYKADKSGIIHIPIGKINFKEEHLVQNLLTIYSSIEKTKSSKIKGKYIKSFFICTTMSPSIQLNINSI